MRNIRLFSFQQSPVLKSVPAVIDNAKVVLYEKITGLNNWYTSVTGLDKVQECQERVTNLQVHKYSISNPIPAFKLHKIAE